MFCAAALRAGSVTVKYSVDVIIPTYKPGKRLLGILKRLNEQTYPVRRIILINTEESYFEKLIYSMSVDQTYELDRLFQKVELRHISKPEFNHGATRRMGVGLSDADIFVCMTDDALPKNRHLIGELVNGLLQEKAAVAYARQLAGRKSSDIERLTRDYNYPPQSCVKSSEDLGRLGIKTYFCSNVCAAYWRGIYDELGGFVKHTIFNEDMIYAAKAAQKGYRIVYQASAQVYHSHHDTKRQQFRRNFDLGVSQAQHPEVFSGIPSEGEGIRMVKKMAGQLWKARKRRLIPGLIVTSACKYAGYQLGKHYKRLPHKIVQTCTGNRTFWEQEADIARGGYETQTACFHGMEKGKGQ